MKSIINIFISFLFLSLIATAQDEKAEEVGLDLNAALDLFSKSKDLNDFEKQLNDKEKGINNLDLNKDDNIDYIRLEEKSQDNIHVIQMIAVLGEKEQQSVASINLEKDANGNISAQIIGDSTLYGPDYIVEPSNPQETTQEAPVNTFKDASAIHDQGGGSSGSGSSTTVVYVNSWPTVQYVYGPSYVVYVSPYYWGYYPSYWHPWPPYPPVSYRRTVIVYRTAHYRRVTYYRSAHARSIYYNNARYSANNRYRYQNQKPVRTPSSPPKTNNIKKPANNQIQKPAPTPKTKPNTGITRPRTGGTNRRR